MTGIVSVKKNFLFSFSEKVFRAALSFVSLGIVGRYLGPEKYGTLSYLLALTSYFQLIGAFGLDQVLMRLFINRPNVIHSTYWETIIFKAFFSTLSILLYLLFLFYNNEFNFLSILFGVTILSSVFDNNRIFLETKNRHHIVAKIEISYQLVSAILKILFSTLDLGIYLIFSLFILDFFVTKIIMFFPLKTEIFPLKRIKINAEQFKFYIKAGGFHCLSTIFVILYMKIDQVMVGRMLGMHALGNYSAAVRISDAWYFIPMTISSVFYPLALIGSSEKDETHLQIIFDLIFWISICVIGVALVFSDEIFILMFGNKFIVDRLVLHLLFISGFFISLCISTGTWLNVKGDVKVIFLRSMIGAIANIGLNLYLIPNYGLIGCGLATLVAYALTFCMTFLHSESQECWKNILRSLNLAASIKRVIIGIRFKPIHQAPNSTNGT